jgi:Leucine-rich repeat (LRR) protein
MDLSFNMLTGVIPSNLSRCTSLQHIDMDSNMGLQGIIPSEIGNLQSLTYLVLSNNSIAGTIPSSLGNLSRLTVLDLSFNYMEGSIPAGISNNQHLGFFQLSRNNISGSLPPCSTCHLFMPFLWLPTSSMAVCHLTWGKPFRACNILGLEKTNLPELFRRR